MMATAMATPLSTKEHKGKLVVVTRIHTMYSSPLAGSSSSSQPPLPHTQPSSSSSLVAEKTPSLITFILSALTYADAVVVCLGAPSLEGVQHMQAVYGSLLAQHCSAATLAGVNLLPVFPWGHFTTALNAAVVFAQDLQAQYVMFQVSK